jgi:hypothetical protein
MYSMSANQGTSLNSMIIIEFNDLANRVGEEENFDIYLIEFDDIVPHIHMYLGNYVDTFLIEFNAFLIEL